MKEHIVKINYNPGEPVLFKIQKYNKLMWKRGKISKRLSNVTYLVYCDDLGTDKVCHVDQLRSQSESSKNYMKNIEDITDVIKIGGTLNTGTKLVTPSSATENIKVRAETAEEELQQEQENNGARTEDGTENENAETVTEKQILGRSVRTIRKPERLDL